MTNPRHDPDPGCDCYGCRADRNGTMKRLDNPFDVAPAGLKPRIAELQAKVRKYREAARSDALPWSTYGLIADQDERIIDNLLAEKADLHLCPHCGRYREPDHAQTCEEREDA